MARKNQGADTAGFEKKLSEFMGLRDSNTLWRITSWGAAATLALAAAVLMTTTDSGSQRLRVAFAPEAAAPTNVIASLPKTAPAAGTAKVTPSPATKNLDTAKLEAQIQELAADRDRLKARIASLEQNLNDMTGSIKRELALVAATAPSSEPKPVPTTRISAPPKVSAPQTTPPEKNDNIEETDDRAQPTARAGEPLVAESAKTTSAKTKTGSQAKFEAKLDAKPDAESALKFVTKPEPRPESQSKQKFDAEARSADAKTALLKTLPGMPKITAVQLPPPRLATATEPAAPAAAVPSNEPALGIELGGARSMAILKKRWVAVKANFGSLVEGLHPLVTYERLNPRIPYRLLVGPLPNGAAAAQMCKRFAASRVSCRTTRFVGEVFAEK